MNRKTKRLVRIIAIVLAVLLIGGVVVSALFSALAEAPAPSDGARRDRYAISMEYLEDEQALHIQQRLDFINDTGEYLDRVVFYAAANLFRRRTALMYEDGDLDAVFPAGFVPGGIELRSVSVNGTAADYGFQGEDEIYLRVACDARPGDVVAFEFEYYLLLSQCGGFIGVGDTDVRLAAFYFTPGVYDAAYHEFRVNRPLSFTRWLDARAADFSVELSFASSAAYAMVSSGVAEALEAADGQRWHIEAEDVREFAMSFGKRSRAFERVTAGGTRVRVLSGVRGASRALDAAVEAVEQCAAWFGEFPFAEMEIAQSDYPLGALNYPGCALISGELFEGGSEEALKRQLRFCVAQQYFGLSACVAPSSDAWLSDSLCAYVACLLQEAADGHEAFLKWINREWVSALQLTIPGGLTVTSDAALFDAYEYDIVVLKRGAVVFHELRLAMGLEPLLRGLKGFFDMGRSSGATLTEMDLVACLDAASGRSWEAFLTDWVFNVGDYVNQSIDWFE